VSGDGTAAGLVSTLNTDAGTLDTDLGTLVTDAAAPSAVYAQLIRVPQE
jgi:hypothetical protein